MTGKATKADEALLEAVALLNPRTMGRAKRLCFAVHLLQTGSTATEARHVLHLRFKVSRSEAWCVVDMAEDMVVERR